MTLTRTVTSTSFRLTETLFKRNQIAWGCTHQAAPSLQKYRWKKLLFTQPAKRTGPSICANGDTVSCFHAGEQHTKLGEASQAGQIASSHNTNNLKLLLLRLNLSLKIPHNLKTTKPPHQYHHPQPQALLFKYIFVPTGSRHTLLGTGCPVKISTTRDPREHFAI